jgi:hypothetical protein
VFTLNATNKANATKTAEIAPRRRVITTSLTASIAASHRTNSGKTTFRPATHFDPGLNTPLSCREPAQPRILEGGETSSRTGDLTYLSLDPHRSYFGRFDPSVDLETSPIRRRTRDPAIGSGQGRPEVGRANP